MEWWLIDAGYALHLLPYGQFGLVGFHELQGPCFCEPDVFEKGYTHLGYGRFYIRKVYRHKQDSGVN